MQRVEIAGLPILTYAAIAPGKTPEQLSWFVQDVLVRGLQGVRGVGRVERLGSVDRELRVGLDPVRLQAVGLTPLNVSRQIRGSNVDLAGGRAEIGGSDQVIRTLAGVKTPADVSATRIGLPTGGEVRFDDLGTIADTVAEPRTFARFNGTPVVGVNILRAKRASDVTVANAVAERVKVIQAANPDVDIKLIDTSVPQTVGNYNSAMHTLYEGAVLVVIVVFLFLRDIRATLVAAIALPLSIIPAFWVMNTLGFSLNLVSLLAIILCDRHHHRRRHRRDRKHRSSHPHGQVAVPGFARCGRGNRPCRHCDQPHDRRGVHPAELHAVGSRPVLQAIRDYGFGAGLVFACCAHA